MCCVGVKRVHSAPAGGSNIKPNTAAAVKIKLPEEEDDEEEGRKERAF